MNKNPPSAKNDNSTSDEKITSQTPEPTAGFIADLVMALRLYSRLPTGDSPHQQPDLSRIALALPFASVVIGVIPSILMLVGTLLNLPPLFTALLAVGAAIVVTGAMAEDALGDCADGLVGGETIEKRLAIFKDSRLGTYGVTALIVFIGLRVSVLSAFLVQGALPAIFLWLGASVLARSCAIWLTFKLSPARKDGASSASGRVSLQTFLIGAGFAILISFVIAAPFIGMLGLLVTVLLLAAFAWSWSLMCQRLIGGQTGDLIGGLQATLEIVALSAFIVFAGP